MNGIAMMAIGRWMTLHVTVPIVIAYVLYRLIVKIVDRYGRDDN